MESQMHAVVMTQRGGPDVLRLVTIDVPKLRTPRDALIRVHAAGVNPSDWQIRTRPLASYLAKQLSGGLILGMEGTGVIAAVGSAVARFRVDEEVYYVDGGLGLHQGNYAQYKVVDAQYLARKPVSLSFSSAGAVPVALITAWESLYERAQVKAGDWALIHGGAGGGGHIALQLAWRQRLAHMTKRRWRASSGLNAPSAIAPKMWPQQCASGRVGTAPMWCSTL